MALVRSRLAILSFTALAAAASASSAHAQAVMGLGDDAGLPPAGSLRLRIQSEWTYYDQRFVSAPGASPNSLSSMLQPLGAHFSIDTLGAARLPILLPLQDSLRSIAGSQAINVSLGRTVAEITDRVTRVPFTLEAGVSRWFSLSAVVPIVQTQSNVYFRANPNASEGNIGLNPAANGDAGALAADTLFTGQLGRAARAVQAYCSGPGAGSAQCAGASTLATSAQAFGRSVATLYTTGPLVPTRLSTAQGAIDVRAQKLRNALNAFAAIPGSGVPSVSGNGVVGAATPLATPDLQTVLSDPSFGVGLDPLQTASRTHLGDIDLTAKLLLFDTFRSRNTTRFTPHGFNARVTVAAGYRLGTGAGASPDNLTEVATGTHAGALLLRGYTDLLFGRHFWTSVVARYVKPRSDSITLRYAPPTVTFPAADTRVGVDRQIGSLTELEVTPRWVFNDFVSIGGQYLYRRKAADTYAIAPGQTNATLLGLTGPDPFDLGAGTGLSEERVGGGLVFSNAHAVQLGRARFPVDVSYLHTETIRGSAGVPKFITDQIMVRVYRSFWH